MTVHDSEEEAMCMTIIIVTQFDIQPFTLMVLQNTALTITTTGLVNRKRQQYNNNEAWTLDNHTIESNLKLI